MLSHNSPRKLVTFLHEQCSLYTKLLCIFIVVFYALSFLPNSSRYFAITPGYLLPPNYNIWTLVTFFCFETEWWYVLLDLLTIFLLERILLPSWGWRKLLKFSLIVNILSAICVVITYYFMYFFTGIPNFLYNTFIHGMLPLCGALTVGGKQAMPDYVIMSLPLGKFRNKHVGFTLVLIFLILALLRMITVTSLLLLVYGLYISWVYLRFYQKNSSGRAGDFSDSFAFASFFPNHLEPPVAIISNTIYSLLIRIGVCKKMDRRYDISASSTISLSVVGSDSHDAERRRQLALKVLNERMSRQDKSSSEQWPSMLDDRSGSHTSISPSASPGIVNTKLDPDKLANMASTKLNDGALHPDAISSPLQSKQVSPSHETSTTSEATTVHIIDDVDESEDATSHQEGSKKMQVL